MSLQAKAPKAKIPLDDLNCVFVPNKIGNLNGMQMSYEDKGGRTRHIFVYSEDGKVSKNLFCGGGSPLTTRTKLLGYPS